MDGAGRLSWLWPTTLNEDAGLVVRVGRVIHWSALGFAIFGMSISISALIEQCEHFGTAYVAIVLMLTGTALLGRGIRYVISRE